MAKVCDFGKEIKKRLVDINQTQGWLIAEVAQDTGKYFDSGYLQRILRGDVATPSIVSSICRILDIPQPTERKSAHKAVGKDEGA